MSDVLTKASKNIEKSRKVDVKQLLKRRNDAKSDMDMWRSLLENAYHYIIPNYNPWVNHGRAGAVAPGQQRDGDVYDLTLPVAHRRFVNKMMVGMVPQGQHWVEFVPGDMFGDESSELYQAALRETQKITNRFFKIIESSNFYVAVEEAISDASISTGFLAVNEGDRSNPLQFETAPVSQVMIEADAKDGFSAVFRDWMQMKVEQIQQVWPGAKKPENKESCEKCDIYECSYVDYDASPKSRYKYVVMTSKGEILYEIESASWPWVIFRFRKLAGESRGRGPSLEAVPTAATTNEAIGDELTAAAFQANPMYMAASDSAYNQDTFQAKPGSIIPVQMIMGNWPISAFPQAGNIQFGQLLVADMRQQINDILYTAPLGPITSPDMTATEANIRFQESNESFAAMAPRLQREFFDPLVKRIMFLINKVLPETFGDLDSTFKDKLLSLDGEVIGLRYKTPLMISRGRLNTQNMLSWYNSYASMVGPEIASATLKTIETAQALAQNEGIDLQNIKSAEEMQETAQGIAEAVEEGVQQ